MKHFLFAVLGFDRIARACAVGGRRHLREWSLPRGVRRSEWCGRRSQAIPPI